MTNRIGKQKLADELKEYLLSNLERKVTIAELAETFRISDTQVKNCFRARFRMPVHKWFRREKMRAAARLLEETDLSVLEIAGRFGFDNGSKFAGAFKEAHGIAPSAYRIKAAAERESGDVIV